MAAPSLRSLLAAGRPHVPALDGTATWTLPELRGRLIELVAGVPPAVLTLAVLLIADAQRRREPSAWIARPDALFFPPDLTTHGIDLEALAVVRAPNQDAQLRTADCLLRSGAFGLVVLDLAAAAEVPLAAQVRLAGLAKQHAAALVCLTAEQARGSLASLRGVATRQRAGEGTIACTLRVAKDKRRGREWEWSEVLRAPAGMR